MSPCYERRQAGKAAVSFSEPRGFICLMSYGSGDALASVLSVQYVCLLGLFLPGQKQGNKREKDNQRTGKKEEKETRYEKDRGKKRINKKTRRNRQIVGRRCQALPEAPQQAHRQKEKQNDWQRRGKKLQGLVTRHQRRPVEDQRSLA
jgi:hypothetical protein